MQREEIHLRRALNPEYKYPGRAGRVLPYKQCMACCHEIKEDQQYYFVLSYVIRWLEDGKTKVGAERFPEHFIDAVLEEPFYWGRNFLSGRLKIQMCETCEDNMDRRIKFNLSSEEPILSVSPFKYSKTVRAWTLKPAMPKKSARTHN